MIPGQIGAVASGIRDTHEAFRLTHSIAVASARPASSASVIEYARTCSVNVVCAPGVTPSTWR